jgi:hypothetical protein
MSTITFNTLAAQSPTEKILRELGCKFERRDDGTYFVDGEINLSGKNLKALPDLSRVHMGGNFYCENNPELVDLRGAPYHCDKNFFCGNNPKLASLVGSPEYVGCDYSCCSNPSLTTLKGAPQTVGLNFMCANNRWMESLEGGATDVGGFYVCKMNPHLKSLEHASQKFMELHSDFGTFKSWKEVPEELQTSQETRDRLHREHIARQVQSATILQSSITVGPTLKLRGPRS